MREEQNSVGTGDRVYDSRYCADAHTVGRRDAIFRRSGRPVGARDVFIFQHARSRLRQYLSDAHGIVQPFHHRYPVRGLFRESAARLCPDVYLGERGVLDPRYHVFLRRIHGECCDFVLSDRLRGVSDGAEKNAIKNRSVPFDPACRTVFVLQGDFYIHIAGPDFAQCEIRMTARKGVQMVYDLSPRQRRIRFRCCRLAYLVVRKRDLDAVLVRLPIRSDFHGRRGLFLRFPDRFVDDDAGQGAAEHRCRQAQTYRSGELCRFDENPHVT